MLALSLTLPAFTAPGDTTPGGVLDVWCWEDDIGVQWETDIFMTIE